MNMNNEKIINSIIDITNALKGTLNGNTVFYGSLKLVFLKYAVDNYIGASTPEEIKYYANAQKIFAMRDTEGGPNFIVPIMNTLDKHFSLNNIFAASNLWEDYGALLFGKDRRMYKVSADENSFKEIMGIIGALNLEENDERTVGKDIVDFYIDKMSQDYSRTRYAAEYASSIPLSLLAKGILNVDEKDKFCDFTSGIGISTITITKDTMPEIICADVNSESTVMLTMMLIMYGYVKFKVILKNTLVEGINFDNANKLFVDPPIGLRIDSLVEGPKVESHNIALSLVADYFSECNGKGVVAVPSGILFTTNTRSVQLRQRLVESGCVEAIVSLPPLWFGTTIGTNMIVISSQHNRDILFVDATFSKEKDYFYDGDLNSKKTLNYIIDVVNSRKEIEGFSKLVGLSELDEYFSFVPTNYIKKIRVNNHRSIEEVDKELEELYSLLIKRPE